MTPRPQLIIMVKEPRPGQVKTRLAAQIGRVEATWWFRHQSAQLIRRLANDPRWSTRLAIAPDRAINTCFFPARIARVPQGGGDLGQRMHRMLAASDPGPVVLIGSDIPDVTPTRIWRALSALKSYDAVFGPAPDGGYWLVGLKNAHLARRPMFENVVWSHPNTLQDSIDSLGPGFRVNMADQLQDIDAPEDFNTAKQPGQPTRPFRLAHT